MSSQDIDAGTLWSREIFRNLESLRHGIVCVTKSNMASPWIHFEAGALAKQTDKSRVIPYLHGIPDKGELKGPLTQLQVTLADEPGTKELIDSINTALGDQRLGDEALSEQFRHYWPELDTALRSVSSDATTPSAERTDSDKLDEILLLARQLVRQSSQDLSTSHSRAESGPNSTGARSLSEYLEALTSKQRDNYSNHLLHLFDSFACQETPKDKVRDPLVAAIAGAKLRQALERPDATENKGDE